MEEYGNTALSMTDVLQAAEEANVPLVQTYVKNSELAVIQCIEDRRFDHLEALYEQQQRRLSRCWAIQKRKSPIPFGLGYLCGMLRMVREVVLAHNQQEEIYTASATLQRNPIPHSTKILQLIQAQPDIQHARLAKQLGIDRSTLSGIMKRMEQTPFVVSVRSGKYKYYTLTKGGTHYLEQLRRLPQVKKPHGGGMWQACGGSAAGFSNTVVLSVESKAARELELSPLSPELVEDAPLHTRPESNQIRPFFIFSGGKP